LNIAVAMDTTKNVKKRLGGAAKECERKKKKLNEAAKTCQNITFFINNKALKTKHLMISIIISLLLIR